MDSPFLPGTRTRLVSKVSDVPVRPGSLVACDLDETLIKSKYISSLSPWHSPLSVTLMNPDDATWCAKVVADATLVYVTARDLSTHAFTQNQLVSLGLPLCPIYFSEEKGHAVRMLAQKANYTEILFVDDLHYNHVSVQREVPHARCYRVDAELAKRRPKYLQKQ